MNLDDFYVHLQDQTDATIVAGIGAVPAKVMCVFGKATAFNTAQNKLDTGIVNAYLNCVKDIAPITYAHMYSTFLVKHRNAEINNNTMPNLNIEWAAVGSPNIMVYVGAAGAYYGEGPDSHIAIWVPGIVATMRDNSECIDTWQTVERVYKEIYG